MNSTDFRNKLEQLKGQCFTVQQSLDNKKQEIKENEKYLKKYEKAKEIIRLVGMETQKLLQIHISDITSLAIESVFDDPYKLVLEFVQRRNKTECDLYFSRNGNKIDDPLNSSGIGTVDVASFSLRIASWALNKPQFRNTIILDEPMKNVSKKYREKVSQMLKEISNKLKIQFIIITHDPVLASFADKTFEVNSKVNGKWKQSRVKEI